MVATTGYKVITVIFFNNKHDKYFYLQNCKDLHPTQLKLVS